MSVEVYKDIIVIIGAWITAILTYKLTSKNDKSKTLSTHFKQSGIEKQKQLLELWMTCAQSGYEGMIEKLRIECKNNETNEVELMKNYIGDILLYASKQTMRKVAIFMQNSFKTSKKEGIEESEKKFLKNKEKNSMKVIYLSFNIMANMKYDFTGEKVKILDLIKLKINDLNFRRIMILRFFDIYYSNILISLRFWK